MPWINETEGDADAIHDNVAGEINALTGKSTPVNADLVLIEDSEASYAKKAVQVGNLPGSGGGGGTVFDEKPFIHTPPGSAATEDDEFNDDTSMSGPVNGLDAKWSKRNLGTASWLVFNDSVAPGCLLFEVPTGQSADQAIYQSVPTGDFQVAARVSLQDPGDRQMIGLFVVDSSGDGTGIFIDNGDDVVYVRQLTSWAQAAGNTTTSQSINRGLWNAGLPVWMYLDWDDTAETADCGISLHDRILVPLHTTSRAFDGTTIAYVGVGRIFGTGTGRFTIDTFRNLT